jgi:tetraacyldisaccharide 4'-kinase
MNYPQTQVFTGRYEPVGLSCPERGRVAIDALKGEGLFAFCGIANPQSFRQTLVRSFLVKGWQEFADHHPFTQADLAAISKRAKDLACTGLITTEKDFVKIKAMTTSLPIWVLAVELRMEPGFDRFVLERLGAPRPSRQSLLDQ